jgi:hypothetical protein
MRYQVRTDYTVVCLGCGDEKDYEDPQARVIAALAKKGEGKEKRV